MVSENDRYLFHEGTHHSIYNFFGAICVDGGVHFTTWAPRAKAVAVVGDFNNWNGDNHQMTKVSPEGIWTLFISGLEDYALYKYRIVSAHKGTYLKSDPFARFSEMRPNTASLVYPEYHYKWGDATWLHNRAKENIMTQPISIYEVNLSSWKKNGYEWLSYPDLVDTLIPYVLEQGFTHIEIMPIMEHPFDGSWGYQITGYFSVTSRYGSPDDFKYFIDCCHRAGIGVILDWVPGHFCKDEHGLSFYDGEPLYEPADPLLRENIEWGTMNFDYARPEVRSFLISNANFWLDVFHLDGLRVDAVAYMLYKQMATGRYDDFSEDDINQDAVNFMKQLNTTLFSLHDNILIMAEESSAFPMVTGAVHDGGLGFNYKWNMGWMHDSLKYIKEEPSHRKHHQDKLTFSIYYAFNENFILPLSHDEVVHGKKSLINKMPGDYWQKFANLRLLMAYQYFHPGKKLNFMGNEFAQFIEWNEWDQLDWHLLDYDSHRGFNQCVKVLNHLYKSQSPLHQIEHHHTGFKWIEFDNNEQSIIAFKRIDKAGDYVIAVYNFTPIVHKDYLIDVPEKGVYSEILNTDECAFYGSGITNKGQLNAFENKGEYKIKLNLPPLGAILIKPDTE